MSIHDERIGKMINGFKILGYSFEERNGKRVTLYKSVCPFCSKEFQGKASKIASGETKSCGCQTTKQRLKNIEGKTFHNLKAIRPTDKKNEKGSVIWECKCACGNPKPVYIAASRLNSGNTKSCGCLRTDAVKKNIKKAINKNKKYWVENTNVYNIRGRKLFKNNTSGYTGVSYKKSSKKWVAQIEFKGVAYTLGYFKTKEEAANVRKKAEENLHGNFIRWFAETYPERWEKINKKRVDDVQSEK